MKISEMQTKITQLKAKTDTCILAHVYMNREIAEIADYVGDSFQISANAKESDSGNLIVCGVRFMAETAKLLNPTKRVFLPNINAGCPMAEFCTPDELIGFKARNPDQIVVAYVNTTAELKKYCDVCVTSSSALKIVNSLDADKILFIPDCNLGDYVRRNTTKEVVTVDGCCPFHAAVTPDDVKTARKQHPNALLLVHPECAPEVVASADYVGSTSGIMEYAAASDSAEFIIGTEMSIREHLQYQHPDKAFHTLSKKISCPDMRMTTLSDILRTLETIESGNATDREIIMSDSDIAASVKCIDKMLELG